MLILQSNKSMSGVNFYLLNHYKNDIFERDVSEDNEDKAA